MLGAHKHMLTPTGLHGMALALRAWEPVLLMLCSLLAYMLRLGFVPMPSHYIGMTLLAAALFAFVGGLTGIYQHHRLYHVGWTFTRLVGTLVIVFALLMSLMVMLKVSTQFSRIWLGVWLVSFTIFYGVGRVLVQRWIWQKINKGEWSRRMAILGYNEKTRRLLDIFARQSTGEVSLVGIYTLESTEELGTDIRKSKLYKGSLKNLHQAVQHGDVDDVLVTLDFDAENQARLLLDKLYELTVNVYYCLPLVLLGRAGFSEVNIANMPLVLLFRRPLEGGSIALKRAMDIMVSAPLLMLLAPLMVLLGVLVKSTSSGPILFRQKRNGFAGREFDMLKFRSMRAGEAPQDSGGKEQQATLNDSRITTVGKLLRRSSLDELPQLINILRGDMSLIGPRPHAISHNSYYENLIDRYASRHKMKPGLTGWAQVNGLRGETEIIDKMAKRVESLLKLGWEHWVLRGVRLCK